MTTQGKNSLHRGLCHLGSNQSFVGFRVSWTFDEAVLMELEFIILVNLEEF